MEWETLKESNTELTRKLEVAEKKHLILETEIQNLTKKLEKTKSEDNVFLKDMKEQFSKLQQEYCIVQAKYHQAIMNEIELKKLLLRRSKMTVIAENEADRIKIEAQNIAKKIIEEAMEIKEIAQKEKEHLLQETKKGCERFKREAQTIVQEMFKDIEARYVDADKECEQLREQAAKSNELRRGD